MVITNAPAIVRTYKVIISLGYSQYHLAVAGGSAVDTKSIAILHVVQRPTRYREVVLTVSKFNAPLHHCKKSCPVFGQNVTFVPLPVLS